MRVVRSGGEPVGFLTSAIRNILRVVDFLPFAYVIGATSILATRKNQRLGDLAAGTLVVRDRAAKAVPHSEAASRTRRDRRLGYERDHRRGGRRRSPLPRAPARDRGRRARRARADVRDAAVAEGRGRAGRARRGALPDAPRRCEDGTRFFDALGSRAHFPAGRERGSADVRAVVPAHGRERAFWAPRRVSGAASPPRSSTGSSSSSSYGIVVRRSSATERGHRLSPLAQRRLLHVLRGGRPDRRSARRRSGSASSTSATAARSATAAASSAGSAASSRRSRCSSATSGCSGTRRSRPGTTSSRARSSCRSPRTPSPARRLTDSRAAPGGRRRPHTASAQSP